MKDILEKNVDEKYYLPIDTKVKWIEKGLTKENEKAKSMTATMHKGIGSDGTTLVVGTLDEGTWAKRYEQIRRVHGGNGKAPTIPTGTGGVMPKIAVKGFLIPEATKKGYSIAKDGDSVDLSFPTSKTRRGRVGNKAKNIMTSQNIGVVQNMRIRKLTPIECERLQGLPDNYTEGQSNTQRYKALGNAFNVDVVAHILSFIK